MGTLHAEQPEVIVTAGATRELIDDVRFFGKFGIESHGIGNFSGGKLGHSLAAEYAYLGRRVLLLAPQVVIERFGEIQGATHEQFGSAVELEQKLLSQSGAKLILHAAAVSDYTPDKVEGKLSSDNEELVLRLRRNPKILPQLRERFGKEATIVGFKLLSGVSEEELVATGLKQIADNRSDYCVANDLQELGPPRKLHLVHADGSHEPALGSSAEVARFIVSKIVPKHLD